MSDLISFYNFCDTHYGGRLQEYQKEIVKKIDKANESDQDFIFICGRKSSGDIRNLYKEYAQSICEHEWSDNVLIVTPEGSRKVTACLCCELEKIDYKQVVTGETEANFKVDIEPLLEKYDYIEREEMYQALCNNTWIKDGVQYSCSWRYAGGLVAREGEDYMTYYCNGTPSFVSDKIIKDLYNLGWKLHHEDSDGYHDYRVALERLGLKY